MLLPGCHISRIYIFFTILITAIIAYPFPEDDKTFNLKIGFDLTHGENGAPALRIRDFEDSNEFNPRAADDDNDKKSDKSKKQDDSDKNDDRPKIVSKKSNLRAASTSSSSGESDANRKPAVRNNKKGSSSEESGAKGKPVKAAGKESGKSSSDSGSGDSEPDAKRSTRGLLAGDADPEDNYPKAPGRDNSEDRRRRKRSPEARLRNKRAAEKFIQHYFENMKRKHKKVTKMPSKPRSTSYKPY